MTVSYRKISKDLYWGFERRRTRYNSYQIALPEKALLDWIYLSRQEGLPTPLDEINLPVSQSSEAQRVCRKISTHRAGDR